ncbi:MAG: hypothetical protein JRI70_08165 [Deltaproteobacteria bacterium]|nr:hypothetical protein [Deltaproteobacteria bacterium]
MKTNKVIDLDEYRALKERLRKALKEWPKPSFIEAGPNQSMRSHPCVAASWVATRGVSLLQQTLTDAGFAGPRQGPYIDYFQRIWEGRRKRHAESCDKAIIRRVDLFAEALREVTQGLFGVY